MGRTYKPLFPLAALITILVLYTPATGTEQIEHERYLERVRFWESDLLGLEYVEDEVIVEFYDSRSLSNLEAAVLEGFEISETFQYRPVAVFKVQSEESLPEALARLDGEPGIKSVSPNLIRHCTLVPNDPLYPSQKYLVPIGVETAWNSATSSQTVKVAVIDTGLDIEHPEFANRILMTENFVDPDVIGEQNVFDDSGHGTAVAGVIAAAGNNAQGITGMLWDVRLMIFRACGGQFLSCTIADEAQAIDAAVANGADVINLSLGGVGTIPIEKQAIQDAINAGVVVVAAAGNGNPGVLFESTGSLTDDYKTLFYPAAFSGVMGVAALDNANGSITVPSSLSRAGFSNYGEDIVEVAAVGTMILSTVPFRPKNQVPYAIYNQRDYSYVQGTSFASPQVAGLAALILARHPALPASEVRQIIKNTAFPMGGPDTDGNSVDDYLGYGLIDAGAALTEGSSVSAVRENKDFRIGLFPSPLFSDDVMVLVFCKRGCDSAPDVTWIVNDTAENGTVIMELLPDRANTWLGRFRTSAVSEISIQLMGALDGVPLDTISFNYRKEL